MPKLIPNLTADQRQRFEESFAKGDGCWIWQRSTYRSGYGRISIGRHAYRAHRVAFALHHGEQPGARSVCHTCDNPACVKPDHLWLGTHLDNMSDMLRKRRANGPRVYPFPSMMVGDTHRVYSADPSRARNRLRCAATAWARRTAPDRKFTTKTDRANGCATILRIA